MSRFNPSNLAKTRAKYCQKTILKLNCGGGTLVILTLNSKSKYIVQCYNIIKNLDWASWYNIHRRTYSSRVVTDGPRVWPATDTSTYLHRDVGYGLPSQINKAQEVQRTFITPGRHRHVIINQASSSKIFNQIIYFIGIVTTTRITHATPGALYAHIQNRDWESDSSIPVNFQNKGCSDIAHQLIHSDVGQKTNVSFFLLGGEKKKLFFTWWSLNKTG